MAQDTTLPLRQTW